MWRVGSERLGWVGVRELGGRVVGGWVGGCGPRALLTWWCFGETVVVAERVLGGCGRRGRPPCLPVRVFGGWVCRGGPPCPPVVGVNPAAPLLRVIFGRVGVGGDEGVPPPEAGHAVDVTSYFDRFWERGKKAKRFFLGLRKPAAVLR